MKHKKYPWTSIETTYFKIELGYRATSDDIFITSKLNRAAIVFHNGVGVQLTTNDGGNQSKERFE